MWGQVCTISGGLLMLRFVVQEHNAANHHFDFRLELDGVLKSWAVPKGVSIKPGEKRLAVETEDHDLNYIDFEGEIEEGNYGAGSVKIWDSGKFKIESRKERKIVFFLYGKRLKGRYAILNFKDKNWLLFKTKEEKKIEKKEKK